MVLRTSDWHCRVCLGCSGRCLALRFQTQHHILWVVHAERRYNSALVGASMSCMSFNGLGAAGLLLPTCASDCQPSRGRCGSTINCKVQRCSAGNGKTGLLCTDFPSTAGHRRALRVYTRAQCFGSECLAVPSIAGFQTRPAKHGKALWGTPRHGRGLPGTTYPQTQ